MQTPKRLSVFSKWGIALVNLIKGIQHRVLKQKRRVNLDCSQIELITPHGAILMYAELDRLIANADIAKPIKIIPPKNIRCRQVFKQIGLLDLSLDVLNIHPNRDDVIYWRCTKGESQSGDKPGELLEHVAEKANTNTTNSLILEDIWPGVSEAVINTTEHAYSLPLKAFPARHPNANWWLLTSLRDDEFAAVVCDLGVGYRKTTPKTVPESFAAYVNKLLLAKNLDARSIQLAMEYGRSRTNLPERGKGSRDALSLLTKHGEGELVIISNTGCVRYEVKSAQGDPEVDIIGLQVDIGATLIWWRLPLMEV